MTTRMAAYTTIALDRIARDPGDGKRIEGGLDLGTVTQGADEYAVEPTPAPVRLDVTVPLRQLFETPTVRRLAAAIEAAPSAPARPSIARADRAAFRRPGGPSGEPV